MSIQPLRILIIRLSALGDIVQAHQALRSNAKSLPAAHWTWAIAEPYLDLLRGEELVDELLPVPKRWNLQKWRRFRRHHQNQRFDLIIDAQCLLKSWLVKRALPKSPAITWGPHQSRDWLTPKLYSKHLDEAPTSSRNAFLKLVQAGLSTIDHAPSQDLNWAPKTPELRHDFRILCALGAGWPTKQIPNSHWPQLMAKIREDCPEQEAIFISGSPKEEQHLQQVWSALSELGVKKWPALSILELKERLRPGDLFIGMDSGPTHLAASRGCLTFTFYGPSLPEAYDPFGSGVHAPRGDCHLSQTFERRCDQLRACSHCSAIDGIDVETAWNNFWEQHRPLGQDQLHV